jgi:3-hydroxybutyryl-CoA dehydrogenase
MTLPGELARVAVVGAGLMGPQIACEYALGGHDVLLCGRDDDVSRERVTSTLANVVSLGVTTADEGAQVRVQFGRDLTNADLVVEAVSEDPELKASVLREAAEALPSAVLASNTSSLSITALGRACGAEARLVGTHYWNPVCLMPLVEVVSGERSDPAALELVERTLRSLGKRPLRVADVPGFAWNRLQFALLREAVWLVEHDVATPEDVDEIVRAGLARRWRHTGPFQTAALGGVETFQRVAENLLPVLSVATNTDSLSRFVPTSGEELERIRLERDESLAHELRAERGTP